MRHYLDDQAWMENRRIMQLVRDIEQRAGVCRPVAARVEYRRALQSRSQVSLGALLIKYPLEQSVAELATYLKLATSDVTSAIDDGTEEFVEWFDANGQHRRATGLLIIYTI